MKINNVTVTINEVNDVYGKKDAAGEPVFNFSASISSDDRGFLERVAAAVHRELAHPQASDPIKAAVIAAGGVL